MTIFAFHSVFNRSELLNVVKSSLSIVIFLTFPFFLHCFSIATLHIQEIYTIFLLICVCWELRHKSAHNGIGLLAFFSREGIISNEQERKTNRKKRGKNTKKKMLKKEQNDKKKSMNVTNPR